MLARTILVENRFVDKNRTGGSFMVEDWLVEPSLGTISREGSRVRLEPKVMDVLHCLSMRPGELVSKRDLTDCVWQVEFISDNRLTRAIADLRRALGDDAATPRYVETIPTRGYRLVAEVTGAPVATHTLEGMSRFKLEAADFSYALKEGENVIGRGTEAEIRVESEWASRRHARIVVRDHNATIEDLGSKNGTFVRGVRVEEVVELHDGDEIGIGRGVTVLRFVTILGTTRTEI
mgnify:CR=1 FL=1